MIDNDLMDNFLLEHMWNLTKLYHLGISEDSKHIANHSNNMKINIFLMLNQQHICYLQNKMEEGKGSLHICTHHSIDPMDNQLRHI